MLMRNSAPLLTLLAALASAGAAEGADFMFRTVVGGETLEGRPLDWTDQTMRLLGRDGQLYEFAPSAAKKSKKTSPTFQGYDATEMRRRLYAEFNNRFEITTTTHYLVAHPRGRGSEWAARFEKLYRSFANYFRVRGFQTSSPQYPLVAVVFPNRSEYNRYVQQSSDGAPSGALGHYEPRSNRVYLFEQSSPGDDRWAETASTVIHEATHQTAYNVGIHTRFADTPRWISEGLATMFEARGVYDTKSYDRVSDRINYVRLHDFRSLVVPHRPLGTISNFISSDDLFDRKAIPAYAQAWALTFFLSETRPQQYSAYLRKVADKPLFEDYTSQQRVADFRSVFGSDLQMLESHFNSYMKKLN